MASGSFRSVSFDVLEIRVARLTLILVLHHDLVVEVDNNMHRYLGRPGRAKHLSVDRNLTLSSLPLLLETNHRVSPLSPEASEMAPERS